MTDILLVVIGDINDVTARNLAGKRVGVWNTQEEAEVGAMTV
jgi:hypothetical protein